MTGEFFFSHARTNALWRLQISSLQIRATNTKRLLELRRSEAFESEFRTTVRILRAVVKYIYIYIERERAHRQLKRQLKRQFNISWYTGVYIHTHISPPSPSFKKQEKTCQRRRRNSTGIRETMDISIHTSPRSVRRSCPRTWTFYTMNTTNRINLGRLIGQSSMRISQGEGSFIAR